MFILICKGPSLSNRSGGNKEKESGGKYSGPRGIDRFSSNIKQILTLEDDPIEEIQEHLDTEEKKSELSHISHLDKSKDSEDPTDF